MIEEKVNNDNNLFDVKLSSCFEKLRQNSMTHPQLTCLWNEYLTNKDNELTDKDLEGCLKAIENMNSIPDISIEQIMIFKEIINFLCI